MGSNKSISWGSLVLTRTKRKRKWEVLGSAATFCQTLNMLNIIFHLVIAPLIVYQTGSWWKYYMCQDLQDWYLQENKALSLSSAVTSTWIFLTRSYKKRLMSGLYGRVLIVFLSTRWNPVCVCFQTGSQTNQICGLKCSCGLCHYSAALCPASLQALLPLIMSPSDESGPTHYHAGLVSSLLICLLLISGERAALFCFLTLFSRTADNVEAARCGGLRHHPLSHRHHWCFIYFFPLCCRHNRGLPSTRRLRLNKRQKTLKYVEALPKSIRPAQRYLQPRGAWCVRLLHQDVRTHSHPENIADILFFLYQQRWTFAFWMT